MECFLSPSNANLSFFVIKKNARLRLILDCRALNILFHSPPFTELATEECLSQTELEIDSTADQDWAHNLRVCFGIGDVADCFHRMRLQGPISRSFYWPPVAAGLVNVTKVEGITVGPEEKV